MKWYSSLDLCKYHPGKSPLLLIKPQLDQNCLKIFLTFCIKVYVSKWRRKIPICVSQLLPTDSVLQCGWLQFSFVGSVVLRLEHITCLVMEFFLNMVNVKRAFCMCGSVHLDRQVNVSLRYLCCCGSHSSLIIKKNAAAPLKSVISVMDETLIFLSVLDIVCQHSSTFQYCRK